MADHEMVTVPAYQSGRCPECDTLAYPNRPKDKAIDKADDLLDLLVRALPYVEDAEKSEDFKPGVVKEFAARIRNAITMVG